MITVSHIVAGTLDYLRNPQKLSSNPGVIVERLIDRLAFYFNQLSLSKENWRLDKVTVSVSEGVGEYLVDVSGRPTIVEVLSDDGFQWGMLNIVRMQGQGGGFIDNLPPGYARPADYPSYAATVTFYNDGDFKFRISPAPSASGTVRIWYEPFGVEISSFTQVFPFLENFAQLFKVDTAIVCIPDCNWPGMDKKEIAEQKKDIRDTLMFDYTRFFPQFEEYRKNLFRETTTAREGFGDECYGSEL